MQPIISDTDYQEIAPWIKLISQDLYFGLRTRNGKPLKRDAAMFLDLRRRGAGYGYFMFVVRRYLEIGNTTHYLDDDEMRACFYHALESRKHEKAWNEHCTDTGTGEALSVFSSKKTPLCVVPGMKTEKGESNQNYRRQLCL